MAEKRESLTGLSDEECQEFHGFFMFGFIGFTVVAAVAHYLVWLWRPWFPKVTGYAALEDGAAQVLTSLVSLIS